MKLLFGYIQDETYNVTQHGKKITSVSVCVPDDEL
jgi:hypothetical protein